MPPSEPYPSDDAPSVLAMGRGAVSCTVLSMSARHADGDDAGYLEWHLLDHLPEQYRIEAIRSGQRWVSTAPCRAARLVSDGIFDGVDHLVSYLFAEPSDPALDAFFDLGAHLHDAGRMPEALPRVHVGIWELVDKVANPGALVGADVIPWRPNRGAYLIIDRPARRPEAWSDPTAALAALNGVAGAWRFQGMVGRHRRAQDCGELEATICYLDDDPMATAPAIARMLGAAGGRVSPSVLLAAPFESVVAFAWDRVLPEG